MPPNAVCRPNPSAPDRLSQSLEAVSLECVRGDRRLFSDVGFALEPGELLHVTGRNGSGKTTLLRMVCGLVRPQTGMVCWGGKPVSTLGDEFFRQLTFVGHLNAIKDELTGRENLMVEAALRGNPVSESQAASALSRMGLKGHDRLPAKVLSQGQRRRTALARLLLADTPLWVLDEPFVALDVHAVETLQHAIAEHVAADGMVVLTTHQEVPIKAGRKRTLHMGGSGTGVAA